ncbi:sodium- and chloride-dependent GABA transporter 1-like isoform X2 [Branchiostoma lanceolatum]|uniref:sodium- and chloride-dependent GABA transporter 1-like isoform X2 n=1 Tax=Branchiostoma lanceolatum TaxID=7740 RepID=UPI00345257DD
MLSSVWTQPGRETRVRDPMLDKEEDEPEHRGPEHNMEPGEPRDQWARKAEFLLAMVGYAVGLGNVWRFPYLCYKSGGGAFLIPYFIMLFLCGIPLLYMELAVGQYTQQGPVGALGKICPLLKGAGLATVVITFIFSTYYNVIITWALYYLFNSFQEPLPWASCDNPWNTGNCTTGLNRSLLNNDSTSPSNEFFDHNVLEISSGIDDFGAPQWDLSLTLLLAWIIVYLCIFKGVKSTGKVVYFTATFPYIVLIALLIRGVTLDGAVDGIVYFLRPKWHLLGTAEVWLNAAAQNFNSIGIAFGGCIALSSYNKFNNNVFKDTLMIACINSATSLLAGFAIFSVMGYMAFLQGTTVEEVATQGPGLAFVVYPQAIATMPVSPLWAILFFIMLLLLGIDSQFCTVEVIVTTLYDHFHPLIRKYLKRKEVLVLLVCCVSYLLGLPNIAQGGMYFFQLIDFYAAAISLMVIAFFEVVAISWIYGANRLARNIEEMTGNKPWLYFIVCWYGLSPILIGGIMIFGFIQYTPVRYGDYYYPGWGQAIGWVIASLSIICLPIGAIHAMLKEKGGFVERFMASLKSKIPDRGSLTFEPEEFGSYRKEDPTLPPSYNDISRHKGFPSAPPLSPVQESAL